MKNSEFDKELEKMLSTAAYTLGISYEEAEEKIKEGIKQLSFGVTDLAINCKQMEEISKNMCLTMEEVYFVEKQNPNPYEKNRKRKW